MFPSTVLQKHLIKWAFSPFSILKNQQKPVEMDSVSQSLRPLLRIFDLLSNCDVLYRPVESPILDIIDIFVKINHLEVMLDSSDVDRLS